MKQSYPETAVMIIMPDENIKDVIRGIRAGVHGFVQITIERQQLEKAIQTVAGKHDFFFDLANETLVYTDKSDIRNPVKKIAAERLPDNCLEYLQLLTTELSNEEIAHKMQLTRSAFQGYKKNKSSVLKMKSRAGMVLFAVKNNLCAVD